MTFDDDAPSGAPEWVLTYGDTMSLLLTFFIMLVSMSETRQDSRFQAVVESLQKRFGHDLSEVSLVPGRWQSRSVSARSELDAMGRAQKFDVHAGGDKVHAPTGDYPRVVSLRRGVVAVTGGVIFFADHEADLNEEQRGCLSIAANELRGKPQMIEVRGHTSRLPLPAGSPFRDPWELAYARARNALDYLVEKGGLEAQRFRLSVAGGNEPIHAGTDPILGLGNSRVEIFLLDEMAEEFRGTSEERDSQFAIPEGVALP